MYLVKAGSLTVVARTRAEAACLRKRLLADDQLNGSGQLEVTITDRNGNVVQVDHSGTTLAAPE